MRHLLLIAFLFISTAALADTPPAPPVKHDTTAAPPAPAAVPVTAGHEAAPPPTGKPGAHQPKFEDSKAEMVKNMKEHIAEMQKKEDCVEAAATPDALRACFGNMPMSKDEAHPAPGHAANGPNAPQPGHPPLKPEPPKPAEAPPAHK